MENLLPFAFLPANLRRLLYKLSRAQNLVEYRSERVLSRTSDQSNKFHIFDRVQVQIDAFLNKVKSEHLLHLKHNFFSQYKPIS